MTMTWTLTAVRGDTVVIVRCENVPEGIRQDEHEAGIRSTLKNLAAITLSETPFARASQRLQGTAPPSPPSNAELDKSVFAVVTLSCMVKRYDDSLSRTFTALVDPTRRAMLTRLASQSNLSVSELAHPFAIKLPAVMKHLDVLADAGLVIRHKVGRTVHCRLSPRRLGQAARWLERTSSFWNARLDNLSAVLEEKHGRRR